jgi:L-arabinose isomerase
MRKKEKVRTGLFGIGLDTYWNQFDGLLDNLKKYQSQIREKIESFGVEVIDAGTVPLKLVILPTKLKNWEKY